MDTQLQTNNTDFPKAVEFIQINTEKAVSERTAELLVCDKLNPGMRLTLGIPLRRTSPDQGLGVF